MNDYSIAGYMLDHYSAAMIQHIEFYTVGQYCDWPNDPAASYSINDCLWQIQKYINRHGRNARPGQDRVDLLKVGHYAAIAAGKIAKIDLGQQPDSETLSARSWEWMTVLSWLEAALNEGGRGRNFKQFDDYIAHLDQVIVTLGYVNRSCGRPEIDQLLEIIFHAAVAWGRLPEADTEGLTLVRARRMHPDARLPEVKSDGAAGADLSAADQYVIDPGQTAVIRTGVAVEIPDGFEGQVRARSGLSAKKELILLNGVGTIDADYRGEIMVPVKNIGDRCQAVHTGDRVAQLLVKPVNRCRFEWAEKLSETVRADGGFGSTGMN